MNFVNKQKYIFGSAGFGMPEYGFSSLNKPSSSNSYLSYLYNSGIRNIDTAPSYGQSEKKIGIFHQKNNLKFRVWTKVDGLVPNSNFMLDKISLSAKQSINNLNIDCLECLYLHQNEITIVEDKFIQKGLKDIKLSGLVKKVGVSVYNKLELESVLTSDVYDVIQLPVSVVNTYLYDIAREYNTQKILVARSIFLQGALLNIENKKGFFNFYDEVAATVKSLKDLASSYKIDYLSMLLSYVNSLENLNHIIISSKNRRNLDSIQKKIEIKLCDKIKLEINKISNNQNIWTNPRNWLS
jgi:aryl-alcohol dehydrogenase-like predicted oxidoreductase